MRGSIADEGSAAAQEQGAQVLVNAPRASAAEPTAGCLRWFVREGRLRSGWRLALYLLAGLALQLIGAIGIALAVVAAVAPALARQGLPPAEIAARIASMFTNIGGYPIVAFAYEAERFVLTLGLVWVFRRGIDRRSFRSLGLQLDSGWLGEAAAGFGFMLAAWLAVFALALGLGGAAVVNVAWARANWVGLLSALGFGLVLNILVGITEETDARGYILQSLAEGVRFWPAVVLSSLYFAILHLLNPGAGAASTLGIFVAGMLLALGYYATRRLWFCIGMHAGWNFAEGPIFGFLVSGTNMGGLFDLKIVGPTWLMGGAFGPEAGGLAIAVELAMCAALLIWTRARGAAGRA